MKLILVLIVLASTASVCAQPSSITIQNSHTVSVNTDTSKRSVKYICCGEKKGIPLFILNGYIISDSLLAKISPDKIQSIDIFKNAAALEQYGVKAKNGVVSLTAKPEAIDELVRQGILTPVL